MSLEDTRLARSQVANNTPVNIEAAVRKLADAVDENLASAVDNAAAIAAGHPGLAKIDDPVGATTDTDDEARAAINLIIDALEAAGITLDT